MAPFSRFQASPYKNALPTPTPPTAHYFPMTLAPHAAAVASSEDWIYVGAGSDVYALGWDEQGKGEKERRSWHAGVGEIVSLAVQQGVWIAVTGRTGTAVFALPPTPFEAPAQLLSLPAAPSAISAHPTTPTVLLAHLAIYSLESDQPAILVEPWTDKGVWATCWSWDGRHVCGIGKDGSVGVWEPRRGTAVVGTTGAVLNHLKPATCSPLGPYFLVTGVSKSRERVVLVIDPLSPSAPLASSVLDYETAALLPVVDQERSIVYLSGRGDSIIKYAEFVKGAFTWNAVGLGAPVESLALAPWTKLDVVSKGEINRLLVLSKQGDVIPVPVLVPQRFYIDFNETTNPPVRSFDGAQSAKTWLDGGDDLPSTVSRDPARRDERKAAVTASSANVTAKEPRSSAQAAAPTHAPVLQAVSSPAPSPKPEFAPPTEQLEKTTISAPKSSPSQTIPASTRSEAGLKAAHVAAPAAAVTDAPSAAASAPSAVLTPKPPPVAPKPSAPAARWSRNFLAGSTPLIPAHDNLDYVSSSYPAEVPLLLATSHLLLFPVSGAGGRVAVHDRKAKGRMPLVGDVKTLEVGTELVDIVLDPLEVDGAIEVVTAGKDGKIKVWTVPRGGLTESRHEPTRVVDAPGLDKVAKLAFSPTVKHLLAVVSNDFGEGVVRIVDTLSGETLIKETICEHGVFSAAWSRSGILLAVACKDRQVRVLDPRQPAKISTAPAFNSPRGFQLEWVDDHQLIAVGHAAGSMRKLQLYTVDGDAIKTGGGLSLDVSPAVLFPHYDPDTSLLWLWCKGSSTILSFDVHPENERQPFAQLPPFTGGSLQNSVCFLPKVDVDPKAIEVAKALRLTARDVQECSWKIPRRHTDRFQDDVFPPTQGPPSTAPERWQAGEKPDVARIDLNPGGMELLSEMPEAAPSVIREKPKTGAREPTTAEKASAAMDLLFEKAKNDLDSDEEERIKGDEEWSD